MSKLDEKFNVEQVYSYKDVYRLFPKAYCDIHLIGGECFYNQKMNQDICDIYIGEKQFCPFRMKYKGLFISTSSGNEFVFYLTDC